MRRLLGPLIIFLIILGVGFLWYKEGLLPVDPRDKTSQIFVISRGETVNIIANNLHRQRLIRNRLVFFITVKALGIERSIQAGDFRLNRTMNAQEVAQALTHGTLDVWVTIIEGLRAEEIAQKFSATHNIPVSVFMEKAEEGFLFPDTYLIPKDADAAQIITILRSNFDMKITDNIVQQARLQGLSLNELVTLASLIERETQSSQDKRIVAGVLLNRLQDGMPLQVDATVQYALGYDEAERTWWKKGLTITDLKVVSPYNTYTNAGLPPYPIASPGLDSIEAVINPVKSGYYFYISDKVGTMHYAKTLEEHNANIKKYLR